MEKRHRGNYVRRMQTDYCVLDTETTGLSAYYDSVIEIAILRVRNNEVVAEYSQLVNPERELPLFITNLTGITNDMLEGQPTIQEIKDSALAFIGDDFIVGHNTNFDMQFLANGFEHDFTNEYMDTLQFAKKLYPEVEGHSLSALAYSLDLPSSGHRAMKDCISTKALHDLMMEKMEREKLTVDKLFRKKHTPFVLDIANIVPTTNEIDEDNFFYGKHCVFTGTLERMPRNAAMQLIVNVGGILDKSVQKSTNYLIVGGFDYCSSITDGKSGKMKKAEQLKEKGQDIELLDEHTFYDLISM